MMFSPRARAWRRATWAQAREKARLEWLQNCDVLLRKDTSRRLPGSRPRFEGPQRSDAGADLSELSEGIVELTRPSQVAVWMMYRQLYQILGSGSIVRMTGMRDIHMSRLAQGLSVRSLNCVRSLWMLWATIIFPRALSSTFHIDTWGVFLEGDVPPSLIFEQDRIRNGYYEAVFPEESTNRTLPGVVHYLAKDRTTVLRIVPPVSFLSKSKKRTLSEDQEREIIQKSMQGVTQDDLAAEYGVSQCCVSKILSQFRSLFATFTLTQAHTCPEI